MRKTTHWMFSQQIRKRVNKFILLTLALNTLGPLGQVLAAPSVIARPGAGVSRLPLGVMSFDAPGFGDLEQAINVANGNLFVGVDQVSTNMQLSRRDEDTNTLGKGGWNYTPRLRLEGRSASGGSVSFAETAKINSANILLTNNPLDSRFAPYYLKPVSYPLYSMPASSDGSPACPGSASGIMKVSTATPLDAGTYRVSFDAKAYTSAAVPSLAVKYGLGSDSQAIASVTSTWQTFSSEWTIVTNQNKLIEIFEDTATNISWEMGKIILQKKDANGAYGANLVAPYLENPYLPGNTTDTTRYWQPYCADAAATSVPNPAYALSFHLESADGADNKSGLIYSYFDPADTAITDKPLIKYTLSFDARARTGTVNIKYGLDDAPLYSAVLDTNWRKFQVEIDAKNVNATNAKRIFEVFETDATNPDWDIRSMSVYRSTTSASTTAFPSDYFLGSGDGSGDYYKGISFAAPSDFTGNPTLAKAPSWIQRYKNYDPTKIKLYSLLNESGLSYSQEWIVQLKTASGLVVAHHYGSDGYRDTFYGDGDYVDFSQNLYQQLRSAEAGDPEGISVGSPKTEYSYVNPASGQISKVKDEWGRVTSYEWSGDQLRVIRLNKTDETVYGSPRYMVIDYTSLTPKKPDGTNGTAQRLVTAINYYGLDGIGGSNVLRKISFEYDASKIFTVTDDDGKPLQTGGIVLNKVIKTGPKGPIESTYTYNSKAELTKYTEAGEPDTLYDYSGTSSEYQGRVVKVTQTPTDGSAGKETTYTFDNLNQLRLKEVKDSNPIAGTTRILGVKYDYYWKGFRKGNLALQTQYVIEGTVRSDLKTIFFDYDERGNVTKRSDYNANGLFTGDYKLPPTVQFDSSYYSAPEVKPDLKPDGTPLYSRVVGTGGEFTVRTILTRDSLRKGVDWFFKTSATGTETAVTGSTDLKLVKTGDLASAEDNPSNYFAYGTFTAPSTPGKYFLVAKSKSNPTARHEVEISVNERIAELGSALEATSDLGYDKIIVAPGCLVLRNKNGTLTTGCKTSLKVNTWVKTWAEWFDQTDSNKAKYSATTTDTTLQGLSRNLNTTSVTNSGKMTIGYVANDFASDSKFSVRSRSVAEPSKYVDLPITVGYFGIRAIQPVEVDIQGQANADWDSQDEVGSNDVVCCDFTYQFAVQVYNSPLIDFTKANLAFSASNSLGTFSNIAIPNCFSTKNTGTGTITATATYPDWSSSVFVSDSISIRDWYWAWPWERDYYRSDRSEGACDSQYSKANRNGTINFAPNISVDEQLLLTMSQAGQMAGVTTTVISGTTCPANQICALSVGGLTTTVYSDPNAAPSSSTSSRWTVLSNATDPTAPADPAISKVEPVFSDQFTSLGTYSYDLDNRLLQSTEKYQTDSTYQSKIHTFTYGNFAASSATQTFGATQLVTDKYYLGSVADANLRRTTQQEMTKDGLLVRNRLSWDANWSETNYTYYKDAPVGDRLPTLVAGTGATSLRSYTAPQYGSMVWKATTTSSSGATPKNPSSVTGITITYKYDALGNAVEEGVEGVLKTITTTEGVSTPTFAKRLTQKSFNGFGQQVWERVLFEGDTTPTVQKGWTYAFGGELLNSWEGTPKNLTIYQYTDTGQYRRLPIYVTKGIGDGTWTKTSTIASANIHGETYLTYDEFGRVATQGTIKNAGGAYDYTSFAYDTLDREVKRTLPDNSVVTTTYDQYGQKASVTTPTSTSTWVRSYPDTNGNNLKMVESVSPVSGKGNAYTRTYTYDVAGNVKTIATTDTGPATQKIPDANNVTSFTYDSEGNTVYELGPIQSTNASGKAYTDGRQAATLYKFDKLNRKIETRESLHKVADGTGSNLDSTNASITNFEYDNFGNLATITDPEGYKTKQSFDAAGQAFRTERDLFRAFAQTKTDIGLSSLTDTDKTKLEWIDGKTSTIWKEFSAAGQETAIVDPSGNRSEMKYNVLGKAIGERDASQRWRKITTYSDDGLPLLVYQPDPNSTASVTSFPTSTPSTAWVATQRTVYGFAGLPTSVWVATPTTDNFDASHASAAETKYEYGWQGKPTKVTLPDGATAESTYDTQGNQLTTKDPDGFVTEFAYNYLNQPTYKKSLARTDTAGAAIDKAAGLEGGLTERYTYDTFGNLIRKNEKGLITDYVYNGLGKVVAESRPTYYADADTQAWPIPVLYKKTAYRLDGSKLAETNYSYTGTFALNTTLSRDGFDLGTTATSAQPLSFTKGNLQVFNADKLGNITREDSFGYRQNLAGTIGTTVEQEKDVKRAYNGLGQMVYQDFVGSSKIYLQAREAATGKFVCSPTGGTSNVAPAPYVCSDSNVGIYSFKTYYPTGSLKKTWSEANAGTARTIFDVFDYEYSPTGRETKASRDVQIRVSRIDGQSTRLTNDPLMAATKGRIETVYTNRDDVKQTKVFDQSPLGGDQEGTLEAVPTNAQRTTVYDYYKDGSRKTDTVTKDAGVAVGTKTYEYDKRGRQVKIVDSNGSAYGNRTALYGDGTASTPAKVGTGTATILTTYGLSSSTNRTIQWVNCSSYEISSKTIGGLMARTESRNTCGDAAAGNSRPLISKTPFTMAFVYDTRGNLIHEKGSETSRYSLANIGANVTVPTDRTQTATVLVESKKFQYGPDNQLQEKVVEQRSDITGFTYTGTRQEYGNCVDTGTILANGDTVEACDIVDVSYTDSVPAIMKISGDREFNKYTSDGQKIRELKEHTIPDPATISWAALSSDGPKSLDAAIAVSDKGTRETSSDSNYELDSRGNRLMTNQTAYTLYNSGAKNGVVKNGGNNGYVKRYDTDDRVAMFYKYDSGSMRASYSDFRYDPSGDQILSSTAAYNHNADGYFISRDQNTIYSSNGEVQLTRKRTGTINRGLSWFLWWVVGTSASDSYTGNDVIKDQTYSDADGLADDTKWAAVVLFDLVPGTEGYVFQTPTTATSSQTGLDPLSVRSAEVPVPSSGTAPNDIESPADGNKVLVPETKKPSTPVVTPTGEPESAPVNINPFSVASDAPATPAETAQNAGLSNLSSAKPGTITTFSISNSLDKSDSTFTSASPSSEGSKNLAESGIFQASGPSNQNAFTFRPAQSVLPPSAEAVSPTSLATPAENIVVSSQEVSDSLNPIDITQPGSALPPVSAPTVQNDDGTNGGGLLDIAPPSNIATPNLPPITPNSGDTSSPNDLTSITKSKNGQIINDPSHEILLQSIELFGKVQISKSQYNTLTGAGVTPEDISKMSENDLGRTLAVIGYYQSAADGASLELRGYLDDAKIPAAVRDYIKNTLNFVDQWNNPMERLEAYGGITRQLFTGLNDRAYSGHQSFWFDKKWGDLSQNIDNIGRKDAAGVTFTATYAKEEMLKALADPVLTNQGNIKAWIGVGVEAVDMTILGILHAGSVAITGWDFDQNGPDGSVFRKLSGDERKAAGVGAGIGIAGLIILGAAAKSLSLTKWNYAPEKAAPVKFDPDGDLIYAPRIRVRGLEDPIAHGFPYSMDSGILSTEPSIASNGYKMYRLAGYLNGKPGFYEIGVNWKGIIDHRTFRVKLGE